MVDRSLCYNLPGCYRGALRDLLRRGCAFPGQLRPRHPRAVRDRRHQALPLAAPRPLLRGLRLGGARRRGGLPAGRAVPVGAPARPGALRGPSASQGGDGGARGARLVRHDLLRYRARISALGGSELDFLEVVKRRRTTNGPFLPDPVSREHQHLLVEVAAMAPSHFNSQPWRFVLVDDRDAIEEVARISGESMTRLLAGSPLLLAVLLDRTEYRPGELSGFYSVFGMGAAVENIWLTTAAIGMGIQFVSTPMEIPENRERLRQLLKVPEDLELMAVYRLGYVPRERRRPTIDWSSRQRKRLSQYVFRNTCEQAEPDGEGVVRAGSQLPREKRAICRTRVESLGEIRAQGPRQGRSGAGGHRRDLLRLDDRALDALARLEADLSARPLRAHSARPDLGSGLRRGGGGPRPRRRSR